MPTPGRRPFPWYDSWWLAKYARGRDIVRTVRPDALDRFEAAFHPLRTPPSFTPRRLEHVLDDDAFEHAGGVVRSLQPTQLELHEARDFGRFVVHGHPFFTELQARLTPLVSDAVGEPVEPRYNFLSLYTAKGICRVHLDAPDAKWTLDLCIAQSTPWPLYLSQVVPWPETFSDLGEDWQQAIRQSRYLRFEAHTLRPREAVIFSGSSQWHYRDPFPAASGHCHLLFFHYVPRGSGALLDPRAWPERFGIPELGALDDDKIE